MDPITVCGTQQPGKTNTFPLIITWTWWPLPQLHTEASSQHHSFLILEYLGLQTDFLEPSFRLQNSQQVKWMYSFSPKLLPSHSWQGMGVKAVKEGFAFGSDWHGCLCAQQQNQVINLWRWALCLPCVPSQGRITLYTQRQVFYKYKNMNI